jgi:sterol desaturase/sphingolipid hydroxylase (fatty acid hydroxylase superfamily)
VDITSGIIDAGLSFFLLFLIFRPLELAHPARQNQRFFRPGWWTDLFFFLSEYLLFNGVVFWLLSHAQGWLRAATPLLIRHGIASMSWWAQAILVVALGDFLIYWGHRLQHRVGFLWRFHAIHHSAEHLDWLAAHREHPVDSLYTIFLVNMPMFALGFPIATLAYFAAFRGLWAVFIHSNVRLPIGPLRILIGAPELHHWHHDRDRRSGNYGNVSPIMDWIFGTYRCPDHEPAGFGIAEPMPRSFLGLLLYPFRMRALGVTTKFEKPRQARYQQVADSKGKFNEVRA